MRKRKSGTAWFRAEDAPQDIVMPCGDHLGAVFELADFLRDLDDDRCSASASPSPPMSCSTTAPFRISDGWRVIDRRLRQTAGLCH